MGDAADRDEIDASLIDLVSPLVAAGWSMQAARTVDSGDATYPMSVSRRFQRGTQTIEVERYPDGELVVFLRPDVTGDDPEGSQGRSCWTDEVAAARRFYAELGLVDPR